MERCNFYFKKSICQKFKNRNFKRLAIFFLHFFSKYFFINKTDISLKEKQRVCVHFNCKCSL